MQLIAISINNLTDARYFAAAGCDWIGFDMSRDSPLTIDHIVAFAEWVEGPKLFIDTTGRDSPFVEKLIETLKPDGLLYDGAIPRDFSGFRIEHYPGSQDAGAVLVQPSHNTEMVAGEKWLVLESKDQTECPDCDALVISGSWEEKVGVKDYEEIDELVELARSIIESR